MYDALALALNFHRVVKIDDPELFLDLPLSLSS